MSKKRPELNSLEKAITDVLKQHPDTSLASLAGRQMLAERLASELCLDAGVDMTILRAFHYAIVQNSKALAIDGMSVVVGIEFADWLEGLLDATIQELASQGFSIFVPSVGW